MSLQYSSEPVHCTVDMERKYLQKLPSTIGSPLSRQARRKGRLKAFSAQSKETKILSEYSCKIHRKNYSEWKMDTLPIEQQIKTAKAGLRWRNDNSIDSLDINEIIGEYPKTV